MIDQNHETLQEALDRYDVSVSVEAVPKLEEYCQRLWQQNEHLNLTRHTTFDKFVSRDLFDTLPLAESLGENWEVLDLGTGGGVPGIPLAILRPDLQISLCESVEKKAKAVDRIVSELGLPIPLHHGRAIDILEDFRFDAVMARAVGSLKKVLGWINPHWNDTTRLFLVKGPRWTEERTEARQMGLLSQVELRKLVEYTRPGNDGASVLLKLWSKRLIPPEEKAKE